VPRGIKANFQASSATFLEAFSCKPKPSLEDWLSVSTGVDPTLARRCFLMSRLELVALAKDGTEQEREAVKTEVRRRGDLKMAKRRLADELAALKKDE
jgi:hypothetical protein